MKTGFLRHIRGKRLLLYGAVAALFALLLTVLVIAFLPALISSQTGQARLRQVLTKSFQRPVAWTSLSLTWSRGLTIHGLALGSGPPPLLSATFKEIAIVPQVGFRQQRLHVDLQLRVGDAAAEMAPGPAKPPKPYQEPLSALATAMQKVAALDQPLPIDLALQVAAGPLRLTCRDSAGRNRVVLSDFSLRLDLPSLATLPLEADIGGKLAVNGHDPEPLQLKATVRGLVTEKRRIRPAAAVVFVDGRLPGTSLIVNGGLQEPDGFKARGRFDLAQLLAAVRPLLKPSTPEVSGTVNVDLAARATTAQDLLASFDLNGRGLALSGGRLKKGRIGPLDLQLRQNVATDHARQQVRFNDGSLGIPGLLTAYWQATVTRPDRHDRNLEVAVGPVRLDLHRALAIAAPLLPPKLPLAELSGAVTVRSLTARLDGRSRQGEILLEDASVTLPQLRLALAKGALTATGSELTIRRAAIPLSALKPQRLVGDLEYAVRSANLEVARPVTAERLRGSLHIVLDDINLKSGSPRRFSARADLTESLDLGLLRLEKQLAITDLHQQLQLVARATEGGSIEASLPQLQLSARSLQATAVEKKLPALPLTAALSAAGIRLPLLRGELPTVDRADLSVSGGDFLRLTAVAHSPAATNRLLTTSGTARLDLDRLLPLVATFLPKGLDAKGVTALSWDLTAPLKPQQLAKGANKLLLARSAAALVDHGEVALTLDTRNIALPTKKGRLEIGSLRTSRPLRLQLAGNGSPVSVSGGLDFSGLAGLAAAGGQLPPQQGSLLLKGELIGWQTLRLEEELRLQPLGISQTLQGTISRLEQLAADKAGLSPATLLKHLDAALTGRVEAAFPERQPTLPVGVELSGGAGAAATVALTAGKELRLSANLAARNLGVKLKNGTTAEGVRADLVIDRSYALARDGGSSWTPLSVTLLHPAAEQRTLAGATEIAGRVREDLRGRESGSRRFSLQRLTTRAGTMTLELTSLEGELLMGREELGLSFLQTEILGGTLRASGVIDLRPQLPTVAASCSFSNLETALLLPAQVRQQRSSAADETELSGEASFEAPLAVRERELLEGLRLKLNLRKIGSATLERALFSLDPYERNERLVAQRKQLRHGNLKRLNATALDGAFSLEGEVQVKGVNISLPEVERIRLSELSLKKELARTVAAIGSLRRFLELLRADTLLVGPKGELSLIRRNDEKQ